MHCYCANYYGSVNCHNKVTQFGDRCKLCTIMNEGQSANYAAFSTSSPNYYSSSSRDSSSREEHRGRPRERQPEKVRKAST